MRISFGSAMEQAGLACKDALIPDGVLHRFFVQRDRQGSKNGWYVLYGDGIAAGAFGSWKTGQSHTWCAKFYHDLTPSERAENTRRMDATRKQREAEEAKTRAQARCKALYIWKASQPAPDTHPYLVNKCVRSHGLRLHKDMLVIPLRDCAGHLRSLQFIDGDGNKRFLSGGRKQGCYFPIGSPTKSLGIAEGYATAASIHESTGLPMAVAFDAGNLMSVTQALREKFPDIEITLCADNDAETNGNPGLTKAREAAAAVGALLAVPPICGDFNDLYRGAI